MSNKKWLLISASTTFIILAAIVSLNLYLDTYGVRSSLFNLENQTITDYHDYPSGLNQHIFNPEYIFQNPKHFDSFLFGSSRMAVIDVAKIMDGHCFNMSYSEGLPGEHLSVVKKFLTTGIKIRSVIIGLEEISFIQPASAHKDQLLRIMHPEISGKSLPKLFFLYFFRKPEDFELSNLKYRFTQSKKKLWLPLDSNGRSLWWIREEKMINKTNQPLFSFELKKYSPVVYKPDIVNKAFDDIRELIALSRTHHFSITFFINPMYSQYYLTYAEGLMPIKEKLAGLTDFYDFSGFNSITTNAMNYYEESHYRYQVGDLIVARIFGGTTPLPDDFGVLVTRQNVASHLEKQKIELDQYLKKHHRQ